MKMKKITMGFTLAIATSLMVLSQLAYGQKELSPSEARDKLREKEMAKVIPLSETFSEEGIWFFKGTHDRDKPLTKDDCIQDGILHFDGKGNTTYYHFTNADSKPTFTELKALSDEEIIKWQKSYRQRLKQHR